jgi:glyoxylase-like metal-dependent hydrolase (beta-lactamase superfamily II)
MAMDQRGVVPDMTAEELVRRIEAREEVHILDVRAPFRLENGRVDIVPEQWFHNIPGSELIKLENTMQIGLPREAPIAVVCGHGKDSRIVSDHLNARGFQSKSLAGGMVAWMGLSVPRELEPPPDCDHFIQFDRIGKGALGYVIVSDGEALVIDPPRHTSTFLDVIQGFGAKVIGVGDTHAHADYISGGPGLAQELGVPYYLHPNDAVYPYDGTPGKVRFEVAEEGRSIRVGRAAVRIVHTPGHTEGSVCYLIGDHAALTGDFVFVKSVGRPDLGGKAKEWTQVLWGSLERVRAEWSSRARIYPAHYSSMSERNTDHTVGRAFEELQQSNSSLSIGDRDSFTEWVLSRTGAFPDAYRRIKAINVGLEIPSETEMDELDAGRNQCSLG